jgi:hypothetical protein
VNATADESAETASAVGELADDRPYLEVEDSKIYGEMTQDGVLVVRVFPAGDTPVAVLVDETLVSGNVAGWKSHGKHRKSLLDSRQEVN